MRRTLGTLAVATLLGVTLFVGKNAVAPQEAGACSYSISRTGNVGSVNVYDSYYGVNYYVHFQVFAKTDGCGHGFAFEHIWADWSNPHIYEDIEIRSWCNGTYLGAYLTGAQGWNVYVSTSVYSCSNGPQFSNDNYGSDAYNTTDWSPWIVSAYSKD